ncbi:NAD-dependent epimerase/dehydratase family protein [Caulobacter sp. KR2-114]|uniref:NAD-dependent epimerase/dehydratase family protein n=1 Tax=Caulobacter sp. KR2-114 TaxID=3400912 RepID=UPI003C0311EA
MPDTLPTPAARTALIIGATGNFGGHVLAALVKRGWTVRALARDPVAAARKAGQRMPVDWIAGDAMTGADVLAAARGCDVIVHAANPPGYKNWRGLAVPMLANTIAAAKAVGARIVFPGNVYNFAPDAGEAIAEDAPQRPVTRKGAIRVEMEASLRAATQAGARVLIVRAGDFFGPASPNGIHSWLFSRRKGRVTAVQAPGPADVAHAFAYLPDLAETTARLLEREVDLAPFEVFHARGHVLGGAQGLAESVRRVTGQPRLPITAFPYPLIYALAPFVELFRELIEMRYLWRKPIALSNAKLVAFLGEEPHTPLDAAVRATLSDMGCLDEAAPVAGARPVMA